jgi:hypothetical protein
MSDHRIARIASAAGLVLLCASVQAQTRELRPVPVTDDHDPLYVDPASVSRSGSRVSFKYVLDVPAALEGGRPRRWRSNEMTAVIDCAANSHSVTYVEAYAGPGATGNVIGRYSATVAERKPAPIVPGGTMAHLAGHLCPR